MDIKKLDQNGLGGPKAKLSVLAALMLTVLAQPVAYAQEKELVEQVVATVQGPDSDGDGIRNQDDLDDDNDGILDVAEGLVDADNDGDADASSTDTDGDGTPDGLDLDSDNDGVLDNLEARADREAVKALDLNPNGAIDIGFPVGANGIADAIETSVDSGALAFPLLDSDGDGTPDFRDTDSDNDGIFDLVEAGGVDSNNDGRLDNFSDADGKGVDDAVQSSALPIFDTDGDGTLDYRDSDSDDDGIPDGVESGGSSNSPLDSDGDGAADYRESDSDGDGVSDSVEAGAIASEPTDSDGDGVPDYRDSSVIGGSDTSGGDNSGDGSTDPGANNGQGGVDVTNGPDTDGDGIANQYDLDDDNDGIPDSAEGFIDEDGDPAPGSRDTDGDGTPDGWDLDSDNDGLLDNREAHPDFGFVSSLDQVVNGAIDIGIEVGSNGLADIIETYAGSGELNYTIQDTDGDGIPDYLDNDSDGDGISDLIEAGGFDMDCDGRIDSFEDIDNKGVDDSIQASALPVFDTDSDGQADYRDTDSDQDGVLDSVEAGPDACRPLDTDGDGAADNREQDSDGDGVMDGEDGDNNATDVPPNAPVSNDVDGDGIPNEMDLDDDNDGLTDVIEGNEDSDNDKTLNQYDLDSDNDGVTDLSEAAKLLSIVRDLDTDGDGRLDAAIGANGLADILESTPDSGTTIFTVADSDGDGVPDFKDLDSDNDSIYDTIESGRADSNADGLIDGSGESDANGLAPGSGNGLVDTDGDTVFDNRDLDSDNDGIPDLVEARGLDVDGDGRIDSYSDIDGNGADDGLQRITADIVDTDSDRVPDFRDLDSDQDGLSDILEVLGSSYDANNDGVIDGFVDGDRDGLDDNLASNPVQIVDTDRDGKPDQVDLDSDGDGVSDLVETGGLDIDSNGTVDSLADSDNDGIPNVVDVDITRGDDSDQDGIDDMADVTFTGGIDTDGDGIADNFDPDSDGNGFAGPSNDMGQGDPISLPDSDGDGTPDFQETDDSVTRGGSVETGLGGSGFGCSIADGPATTGKDPAMLALLLFALASLTWRIKRRVALRPSGNSKGLRTASLLGLLVSAVVISGCSSIGLGGFGNSNRGGSNDFKGRVYAGAGGLVSNLEPDADGDAGVTVDETQSAGFTGLLGYDISNRFSVEGHYSDLGEATFEEGGSVGYQVGGISGLMYFLNDERGRARREGFSMYGRLGAGAMQNQGDGVTFSRVNDYHLLAGVGAEYGLRNGLGIRAELVSHETDAKYGQLGLVYRFGSAGRSSNNEPAVPDTDAVAIPAPMAEVSKAPLDSDSDGVVDSLDACPATDIGSPVNAEGCELFNGVIEGVNFESGSDQLTADSQQVLSGVAQTLQSYPTIRVAIEAHTDNQGAAAANLELSKRRAISVARYLVDEGVSASRLQPQAYGESQPRETNESAQGRARNRRVEFKVVN